MDGTFRHFRLPLAGHPVAALLLCGLCAAPQATKAQPGGGNSPEATLGLESGLIELETPDFELRLVKASQTLAGLEPKETDNFDFTPADQLERRQGDNFFHNGDLNLRLRVGETGGWERFSTAYERQPVTTLAVGGETLASADITPTMGAVPLQVVRSWKQVDGELVLEFRLTNNSDEVVQVGALNIPLIFNNFISGRSLEEAHVTCSFTDPYIGLNGGYVQVTRLDGSGPALVVVEHGNTPLEAYNPLSHERNPRFRDRTPVGQTFEGFYEWVAHSRAYADNEWSEADPWNPPTMASLAPGETRTYGLTYLLSPSIRGIEATLAAHRRPVAVGIPGYIVPRDEQAKLFIKHDSEVSSIEVEPAGAVRIREAGTTPNGWRTFEIEARDWGRARVTLDYADGKRQSVHYYLTKPAERVIGDMGEFLFSKAWYTDTSDPFHRAPAVMNYDRANDAIVLQDARVWVAGLGDEGGTGGWVASVMKQLGAPDDGELAKLERFIDETLWGDLQVAEGPRKYGVRKSLFFYEPEALPGYSYSDEIDWTSWTSWSKRDAYDNLGRSYNYPHIAAAHWTLYRLARNNPGLVNNRTWEWYLDRAARTGIAMTTFAPHFARHGQMEGSVFIAILEDLKREGWSELAAEYEQAMRERTARWVEERYPFGSEMAWDSTGQEEVYGWCKYFGYDGKAAVTLNAILGYMPTVPHWGYNGNARRYWDFYYGAAPGGRLERQIHHYGSMINAIPVLDSFREDPSDFHLLRVGYGGSTGTLSNIDSGGFPSAAFHASPDKLRWDDYIGDFGPNIFGHAWTAASYLVDHDEFGLLGFGANITAEGDRITVEPVDTFRTRSFLAPLGLWLTLDAGEFEGIEINRADGTVVVELAARKPHTPAALLRIEQPASIDGVGRYGPAGDFIEARGGYQIPLQDGPTRVTLKPE